MRHAGGRSRLDRDADPTPGKGAVNLALSAVLAAGLVGLIGLVERLTARAMGGRA